MAANWRHLSRVLSRRWRSTACKYHQSALEPRGSLLRACLPNSLPAATVSPWSIQCRYVSANTVGNPEPAPGFLTRFWRWFNDEVDEEVMCESEALERHALLQKVQEMYFAKPPVTPSLDFFKEVFRTLMKYDDGLGVETLWNSMSEMKVEPDAELKALVIPFLAESRKRSWFE